MTYLCCLFTMCQGDGKGTKICIAPHRENLSPLKRSCMDRSHSFDLQIHHTCLYLVSVHQTVVVAAV